LIGIFERILYSAFVEWPGRLSPKPFGITTSRRFLYT
jgi:hypothetical protein